MFHTVSISMKTPQSLLTCPKIKTAHQLLEICKTKTTTKQKQLLLHFLLVSQYIANNSNFLMRMLLFSKWRRTEAVAILLACLSE